LDRCALFVDAGYALADGAFAVHGTRHRDSVSWDYAGLLKLLAGLSRDRTGLPVLRCYWYEATVDSRRTPEHDTLADIAGLKLRLGKVRPGRREGVETEIRRDLTALARNKAVSDVIIVSAEEDLAQVISDVQDQGIRVALVHIAMDGEWSIARTLRQECDDIIEISAGHLRPYVDLIAGAEPASRDDEPAVGYHARGASGDALRAAPAQQTAPARALPAAASLYPAPVTADYSRLAESLGGSAQTSAHSPAHGASNPATGNSGVGNHGVGNPGVAGAAAGSSVTASAGGESPGLGQGMRAGQPGQDLGRDLQAGQDNAGGRQGSAAGMSRGDDQSTRMPAHQQYQLPEPLRGSLPAHGQTGQVQNGLPPSGLPQNGLAQNGLAQNGLAQNGPAHGSVPPQGSGSADRTHGTGLSQQNPGGLPQNGLPQNGLPQSGLPQSGLSPNGPPQNGMSRNGLPQGHGGPPNGLQQNDLAQNGLSQNGLPSNGLPHNGLPPGGQPQGGLQPQNGLQPGGPTQNGLSQNGLQQGGLQQNGFGQHSVPPQGPGAGDFPRGGGLPQHGQSGLPQNGLAGPDGQRSAGTQRQLPAGPGQQYPSGLTAPYGGAQPQQPPQSPYGGYGPPMQPYPPQAPGPYDAQQLSGQVQPVMPPPIAISLADAVQAAHAEGFGFGEAVARDAPALWLEAVLARKPRMPSDLEARLLQGSALPIDSLLHDEVRHALRRGFWDALERSRR
jgi:NYN domain